MAKKVGDMIYFKIHALSLCNFCLAKFFLIHGCKDSSTEFISGISCSMNAILLSGCKVLLILWWASQHLQCIT